MKIFKEDPAKTEALARKYFQLVHLNILKAALARIRTHDFYCEDFTFTEEEIKSGLELREIEMNVKEVKRFFTKT